MNFNILHEELQQPLQQMLCVQADMRCSQRCISHDKRKRPGTGIALICCSID